MIIFYSLICTKIKTRVQLKIASRSIVILSLITHLHIWWITITYNFIATQHIFMSQVSLDKSHELQWTQFTICGIIYVCNLCNPIAIMQEQPLCDSNAISLQLLLKHHVDVVFHPCIHQWWILLIFVAIHLQLWVWWKYINGCK
jgi:hypothetical protein